MRCRNMTLGNPLKPAACQNDSVSLQPGGCVTLHIWFLLIRKCLKKVCFGGKATFPTLYRTYIQQCYIKLYPPTVPTTLTFAPLTADRPLWKCYRPFLPASLPTAEAFDVVSCSTAPIALLLCSPACRCSMCEEHSCSIYARDLRAPEQAHVTQHRLSATGIHCVKPEQGAASARRVINECKKMSSRVVLF